MLDTHIQMNKFFTYKFIGISPNSVCFKYAFLVLVKHDTNGLVEKEVSCGARRPGFKSRSEQYCFGFVRSWLGDDEIGEWLVGEKGNCLRVFVIISIENTKNNHEKKLFLLITICFWDWFCKIFVEFFSSWDRVCTDPQGCSQRLPWYLWRCII